MNPLSVMRCHLHDLFGLLYCNGFRRFEQVSDGVRRFL